MGNASKLSSNTNSDEQLRQEQERLRDVTIDAAFSTYSRMQYCKALTLRSLKASTKKATSRAALKRQAKLLADNYKNKRGSEITLILGPWTIQYNTITKEFVLVLSTEMSRVVSPDNSKLEMSGQDVFEGVVSEEDISWSLNWYKEGKILATDGEIVEEIEISPEDFSTNLVFKKVVKDLDSSGQ